MLAKDGICQSCCRGIYSCYWNQRSNRKPRCVCCWFSILFVVFLLTLVWMYVCLVAFNDHDDVNWKAFSKLKQWVNWFMVVVIISAVLVTYCCLLLLIALFQVALREPLDLHWLHKVLLFVPVLFIATGVAGISCEWRIEWYTVRLSLQATAPFLQLGGVGALILLSWFVFQRVFRSRSAVSATVTILAFMAVSTPILLCPLFITSPCLLEKHLLPPKPVLIGHRGAPMLAPENTMMSFRRSLECGVIAFETDVQVSMDRVPFLMHDRNLQRTTDVSEVYKDREHNNSSQFTWEELQALNAGDWFITSNPFRMVSTLMEEEVREARNQSIPSLAELLELAKEHNVSLIFDMKDDQNDKLETNWTHHTLRTIIDSNISPDQVLWLPLTHRKYVKRVAPGFRHVYASMSQMTNDSGDQLNINYRKLDAKQMQELREKKILVNMWVVNEPWLFSLVWCSGASSVTTNDCHSFKDMTNPVWHMSPYTYKIIWITVDVGSLLVMLVLFFVQRYWHKSQKRKLELRNRSAGWNQMELHPFLPS